MGETLFPETTGLSSDQIKEIQDAQARQGSMIAGKGIASALSNILPDETLPGVASKLPFAGGLERILSFVKGADDIVHAPEDLLGIRRPPVPDFIKEAGKHIAGVEDRTYDRLPGVPKVNPDDPIDVANSALGSGLGAMAPLAPASIVGRLPSVVGTALKFVLPTTELAGPKVALGGVLGGLGGAAEASDVVDANAAGQPSTPIATALKSIQPTGASTDTDQPQPSGLGQTLAQIGGSTTPSTGGTGIGAALQGITPGSPAPTFDEEGASDQTVGHVLRNYGLTLLGLAGAVFLHRLGGEVTQAGRDARMNDPAYAQAAADYNNAQIAKAGSGQLSSGISAADQPTAPLPRANIVQPYTTKVRGALLDATAGPEDYIKLHSDNPSDAEKLYAEYGMIHNNAAWDARIQEFLKTGRDHVTGITVPSPKDQFDDVAALSRDDKKVYQDTRAALNELDNRRWGRAQGSPTPEHDFPHLSDAQLAAHAQQGMSDPVIADLVNRANAIMSGLPRIGEARGFFTAADVNLLNKAHPNYLAEADVNGKITHSFGPRSTEPYTGVSQINAPAWSVDAQHIEALYRRFELNEMARMVADKQLDTQAKYPNSAQFVTRLAPIPNTASPALFYGGDSAREPILTVRRSSGLERYRVDNPDWLNMARGENANKQRIMMNSIGISRRLVSQLTTGTGAVLSGRAFPITHLPRAMLQSQVNLPRNYVSGLSDFAMKKLTGGRVGQRIIPDPSFILGSLYSNARSAADDLAFQMHTWLKPGNDNIANNFLRATITPAQVDAMSDSLARYYYGTTTHEMNALGVTGAGNIMKATAPAYLAADGTQMRLASNALVPKLFMVDGKLGAARPWIINLRQAAEHILGGLNDSGNQYLYRLNKAYNPAVDTSVLGRDVRRFMGDPGEMGGAKAVQGLSSAIPYFNVSVQGTRATARAFSNAPVSTTASYVGALGSLAALSILTAMRSPAHLDHLQNTLTTQQRGANVVLYTDPDPTKNVQISLPQEFFRASYGLMLDMMAKGINLAAVSKHEGFATDVQTWLKDFLSEHVENSSLDSFMHGITDMTNFADIPSIMNAFIAATGNTLHISDWSRIYNDIQTHQFGFNSFVQPVGGTHVLPNQAVGDSILEGENGKRMSTIFSNLFGLFGGSLDKLAKMETYYNQTKNMWDTLGYIGRDWLQGMRDSNPAMNTILFENQVRASVRPPVADDVENTLRAMKATQGGEGRERYTGYTGKNGLPVPDLGGGHAVPTDPQMAYMWDRTANMYKFIEGRLMPRVHEIEGQMGGVSNQAMSPEARREWMNARMRDKADAYRNIKPYIEDLNAMLSRSIGKHVNVATIDWSKGPEQFRN